MTSRHVTLHCVRRHGRVDISRLSRIDLMVYLLLRKSIAKSRHPSLPYSLRHNIDNLYILLLHTYIIASTIGNGTCMKESRWKCRLVRWMKWMCLTKLYIVVVIAGWLMTMRILSNPRWFVAQQPSQHYCHLTCHHWNQTSCSIVNWTMHGNNSIGKGELSLILINSSKLCERVVDWIVYPNYRWQKSSRRCNLQRCRCCTNTNTSKQPWTLEWL